MAAQIITQVIIIGTGAYESGSKARTEWFNEVVLMSTLYTIMCFSPLVQDVATKFYIGYVCIAIVISHLLLNIGIIFYVTLK